MMDGLLAAATLVDLQRLMANRELSAAELVTYYVARIRRYDVGKLNAVMELNPQALAIARELDTERASGRARGPLHGIPVLIKDNIATGAGMRAAAGAWALQEWQPRRDAFLVAQLRKAGAVILGKTNLSEWANYMDPSMPNGFSVLGGQARCPCGPFDPSGSSSGSGVAVAANLAAVAVGSETQGSIIMPAVANAVVGLKVSLGLISRDHIIPLIDWMDVPGPMGRTVTDVAVLLGAITAVDSDDPATQAVAAQAVGGKRPSDYTQYLDANRAAGMRLELWRWTTQPSQHWQRRGQMGTEMRRVSKRTAAKSGCGTSACMGRRTCWRHWASKWWRYRQRSCRSSRRSPR
ncbi:MAG: amidase family protein [Caldilineaceae bacterium]